jgi:hypothetical protein
MSIDDMRAALGLGTEVDEVQVVILYGQRQRAAAAIAASAAAVVRDPFAQAMGVLFQAAGTVAAEYDDGESDEPLPIRVIRQQGDAEIQLPDGSTVLAEKEMVQLQRSDVDAPRKGDYLTIGDEQFRIMGKPRLDSRGLSWSCELESV